eukprot:TRINITY_DN2299_c0_g1_i3.p1 TRINITY_DN2299_c0_g1~~TRINITY_DN2299_c0_g1_i3.p1  ORF type:complete len:126 (-),score=10.99 TRINITY_DN2299_c0_g1_i3:31-408(-)
MSIESCTKDQMSRPMNTAESAAVPMRAVLDMASTEPLLGLSVSTGRFSSVVGSAACTAQPPTAPQCALLAAAAPAGRLRAEGDAAATTLSEDRSRAQRRGSPRGPREAGPQQPPSPRRGHSLCSI